MGSKDAEAYAVKIQIAMLRRLPLVAATLPLCGISIQFYALSSLKLGLSPKTKFLAKNDIS